MTQFEGRFKDCDDSLFPEVSNYNFIDNKLYRGIDDRTFRFEDVSIKALYQFRELTISGSFELNNYTGFHTVTNFTGVNYITNLTIRSDATGFPGWTITGGYTLWMGISGATYNSGDLSGLSGSFRANPITNNEAIGMWNHSSNNQSASIISRPIATGAELINTGVLQFYGLFRCNYSTGTGEYIIPTVRGWNSNTIVAYIDPATSTWSLTPPTPVFIPVNEYKEVKYIFEPSNFPAATPTGYNVYISLVSTGGYVTADDVHLDSRLARDTLQDFILPSGYMLEITPDLGWHNPKDMFENDGESNNPHLKTLGLFGINLGNLTDNLDNTVSLTIDESDFNDVINDRYTKYLWRVIAVGPNSSLGPGGTPQKFNYVTQDVFAKFSITSITDLENEFTKGIVGTKSENSIILVDDVEPTNIVYTTNTTWKLTLYITDISRTVKIQAMYNGVFSSAKYVSLALKTFDQKDKPLWNAFDEHGLLMDIERLPDESNDVYKQRIKDVYRNRGGSTFAGIVNGATRELGLTKITDGLSFSIRNDFYTNKHTSVYLDCTATSLRLTYDNLIITEIVYVDPVFKTFDLSNDFRDLPIACEIDNGKAIKLTSIERPLDIDDFPLLHRLKITDPDAYGNFIKVTYQYYHTFQFKDYPEIGALAQAINSLGIVDCTISNLLSGNEDSLGLFIVDGNILPNVTINVPWSSVFLKQISDKAFREFNRDTVNYRTSKFYKYVSQLKSNSRTLWGAVEADRDYWDAAGRDDLSFDHLPTLMDPPLSEFFTTQDGESVRIESIEAWARGYTGYNAEIMKNLGISNNLFQPGVSYNKALLTDLTIIDTSTGINLPATNISKQQLDNNFVLFSGQR